MNLSTLAFLAAFAAPTDFQALAKHARDALAKLVAIDTASPPGNEIVAANWAKEELARAGIPATVLSPDGKRGNVIARLKGDGSKRPVLLLAHLDVVGFTRLAWRSDPLTLVERDGFLYGRGVADDKGMAAFALVAFIEVARLKLPLARDVILALTADEESGGDEGIRWLLKHHRDLIDAEFAINEGGQIRLYGDGEKTRAQVGIQTSEKLYLDIGIAAHGKDGHSSVPEGANAINRIANALAHLADVEFPVRLNATTREYFKVLAGFQRGDDAAAMGKVGEAKGGNSPRDEAIARLSRRPFWNSLLRTTCIATLVSGGIRVNALPSEARANINCRVMPEEDPAEVVSRLRAATNDQSLGWRYTLPPRSPTSPIEGPAWVALRVAAEKTWPNATLMPFMSAGGTDSRWLRAIGIPGYGIGLYPTSTGASLNAHGHDERIPVRALADGPRFLYEFLVETAVRR